MMEMTIPQFIIYLQDLPDPGDTLSVDERDAMRMAHSIRNRKQQWIESNLVKE